MVVLVAELVVGTSCVPAVNRRCHKPENRLPLAGDHEGPDLGGGRRGKYVELSQTGATNEPGAQSRTHGRLGRGHKLVSRICGQSS
ncbi:MAG: hypothetical protein JWM85_3544 [Acidimicrobiaceae bacterium]|nr:hypothetical protein [Acidimicrobiaceae bacterium]